MDTVITVRDNADPRWSGAIAVMVDRFNAVMPASAPRLAYVRDTTAPCDGDMVVCSGETGEHSGYTLWHPGDDTNGSVMLSEGSRWIGQPSVVCHEFMHALAHVVDNYGARSDSCVWGVLDAPGAYDRWLLERRFDTTLALPPDAPAPPQPVHKKRKKRKKKR